MSNLHRWNIGLTVLHLGQAVLMLFLTSGFAIAVITSFPDGPPGTTGLVTSTVFDLRIGWAVALFLAVAGLDHLLTATVGRKVYERDLKRGINRFRWVEYSMSATIMVIISLHWGINTINALIVIAGANIAMILFGWLQEWMNPPGRTSTSMMPFCFGLNQWLQYRGVRKWTNYAFGETTYLVLSLAAKSLLA